VERKIGSGEKCALSSSEGRDVLKKQTAGHSAKSYRALGRKIQVYHNTVEKYLTKMRVFRKTENPAPKTTVRQQSVIKARLKLLTQNIFSVKSIYKCNMDDESYFTVFYYSYKLKFSISFSKRY
jgi:hypothetical protein